MQRTTTHITKFQTLHQTPPYLFMLTSMLVAYLFCFELKSFPKPWSLELDVLPARPTTKKAYTPSPALNQCCWVGIFDFVMNHWFRLFKYFRLGELPLLFISKPSKTHWFS
jgi:hypothetical protein